MKQAVLRDSGEESLHSQWLQGHPGPYEMEAEARPEEKGTLGNRVSFPFQRTRQLHRKCVGPSLPKFTFTPRLAERQKHRKAQMGQVSLCGHAG